METIRHLVQVLVAVVVLAVFLDMLLPKGDLKGYVRMIMGLLVMVAMLQAAGELFHLKMDYLLEPLGSSKAGFDRELAAKEVLKKGEEISSKQRQKAAEHMRRGVENQVLALARLHSGQKINAVEVKIAEGGEYSFGRLEEIVLHVNPDTAIPDGSPGTADLVGVLAGFYNLKPHQVKIIKD